MWKIARRASVMSVIGFWFLLGGAASAQTEEKKPAGVKSKIKVTLPQDDAELFIEKKPTKATGKVRDFDTPVLEAGSYEYEFMVKWRPNNYTVIQRTRKVTFKAGDPIVLDMTKDDPNEQDKAVIRYVPTPEDIVDKMIKLAEIKKEDIVFEPGCGDARITIAAVRAGAKKGVGIDLDAERITESKSNVKSAGLSEKIDIRLGDALEIKDLSDATVVFLYMGDEFDMMIRPILWKQLKVGTRIVSHRFLMGDWKPDQTQKVKGSDGDEYEIHLWTITKEIKDKADSEKKPDMKEEKKEEKKTESKEEKKEEKKTESKEEKKDEKMKEKEEKKDEKKEDKGEKKEEKK